MMYSNYQDKGSWHLNNMGLDDQLQDIVHNIVEDNFVEWSYILDSMLCDTKNPFVSRLYQIYIVIYCLAIV